MAASSETIMTRGIGQQLMEPCWGCDGRMTMVFYLMKRTLENNRPFSAYVPAVTCADALNPDNPDPGNACREFIFADGTQEAVNASMTRYLRRESDLELVAQFSGGRIRSPEQSRSALLKAS